MSDDYKSSAPTAQLGGAKRKNGQTANGSCHICENIKNKAKRGGYEEEIKKGVSRPPFLDKPPPFFCWFRLWVSIP